MAGGKGGFEMKIRLQIFMLLRPLGKVISQHFIFLVIYIETGAFVKVPLCVYVYVCVSGFFRPESLKSFYLSSCILSAKSCISHLQITYNDYIYIQIIL